MATPPPPPTHVLKRVTTLGRERTPIALQNENGPCPLLACTNALLLRGDITLPAGPEVTQATVFWGGEEKGGAFFH